MENNKLTNDYEKVFSDWKMETKELNVKEEDLEQSETRYNEFYLEKKCTIQRIEIDDPTNDYEKIDKNVVNDWKIKTEELNIKEEDLERTETSSSFKCNRQSKHEACPTRRCQYSYHTTQKHSFCENYEDIGVLKHKRRIVQTVHKRSLDMEINVFKCDQCDYHTVHKYMLKGHLLRHKNHENDEVFKCDLCAFQTFYKYSLKGHILRHGDYETVDFFKCDHCDFQTIYKRSLRGHVLRHRIREEIKEDNGTFKCDQCDFQTVDSRTFKRHRFRHRTSESVNEMFRCDQCDYRTVRKYNLTSHVLKHKQLEENNMFKCDHCDFKTVYKSSLKRHLLRHENDKEIDVSN